MKQDLDGFNRSVVVDLESYLDNRLGQRLHVEVIHAVAPMSQTKRQYLEYIKEHPGCNTVQIQGALDKANVAVEITNFVNIGYVDKSEKSVRLARLTITSEGLQALGRGSVNQKERAGAIAALMSDYEPYVPEKSHACRPGSQDAFRLKSKGTA